MQPTIKPYRILGEENLREMLEEPMDLLGSM